MNAQRTRPFVVGLTGGIGSGKTTVCSLFADRGVEIIDADVVSRKLVAPGSPALQQLTELFGPDALGTDGTLNRAYLRQLVFVDAMAKKQLEQLLHPLIRSNIVQQIARSNSPWLILAAPLLLENRSYDFVDRVLVVDADEAQQLARTTQRDRCGEDDVRRIMQTQLPRAERLAQAHDVIHNDGNLAGLEAQVDRLYSRYEALARE
ncbi:MAG TPA: dephospho-CoA kinase [Candidatus Acidoferrum sp.]|nr:dephospho-CoA kinase [Candidatus Acidoferrum sp.]